MATIKILDGSIPKQSALYAGNNMTIKTREKGIKSYWMQEATVSVSKITEDKRSVTFDLELRDGEKVQASATHKVFNALQGFAKPTSNLNYLSENQTPEGIKKQKNEMRTALIIGGIVLIIAMKFIFSEPSKPKFNLEMAKINAYLHCRILVENSLKAPRTAKFPFDTRDHVKVSEEDTVYTVNSYVDSQNSYGAMIRTPFSCVSVYDKESDKWALVDFKISE